MSHTLTRRQITGRPRPTALQAWAGGFGLAFLAIGILGFLPTFAGPPGSLRGAGSDSGARLLDFFAVSGLHNALHLLLGVLGLLSMRTAGLARLYLVAGGGLYLLLAAYGGVLTLAGAQHSAANVIPVNGPDDWLHAGLGLAMLLLVAILGRRRSAEPPI